MYRVAIENLLKWKESKRRKPFNYRGSATGRENLADEGVWKTLLY